ncbi:hypothetical protein HOY80DRAFT_1045365 [Tuber brumale]|nr:hypothetical protein HOY80DRAFT_1045365 [Tuber brumale]
MAIFMKNGRRALPSLPILPGMPGVISLLGPSGVPGAVGNIGYRFQVYYACGTIGATLKKRYKIAYLEVTMEEAEKLRREWAF